MNGGDRMLVEMKPNEETRGMVCGGCGHAFSSHKITVNTNTSKLNGKCKVCGCNGISEG